MNFELVPYIQNESKIGVKKLSKNELDHFHKVVNRYNSIIKDDILLSEAYDDFALKKSIQYMSFINPYSGLLNKLYKKGILPSVFTHKKLLLQLNLIRCQSHKELLERILVKEVEKKNTR